MNVHEYEIIIIGSGPAGSSAAIHAKKSGNNVLLIEAKQFPRNKACGGLLTEKTISILKKKLGIVSDLIPIKTRCKKILLHYKDKELISLVTDKEFMITLRSEFDLFLQKKYLELGGEIIYKRITSEHIDSTNKVIIIDGITFKYKLLIGADGANSIVRKILDTKFKPDGFAMEIVSSTKEFGDDIQIFLGNTPNGYDWYFPLPNASNLGSGSKKIKLVTHYFNQFQTKLNIETISHKALGSYLSLGNIPNHACNQSVAIVGDAAGLTDPIFGEGIYFAIRSGIAAVESFREGRFNPSIYLDEIHEIHSYIRLGKQINRYIIQNQWLSPILLPYLGKKRSLIHFISEIYLSEEQALSWNLVKLYRSYCSFKRLKYGKSNESNAHN
jgi:geranylgeranyl reductase family protein